MAHFYGGLQGNRGEANRCGTKQSGISVWAQSWRARVEVELYSRNDGFVGTLADISIRPGPASRVLQYFELGRRLNVEALLEANEWDETTRKHLNAARQSLQKANEAAEKGRAKAAKLTDKIGS